MALMANSDASTQRVEESSTTQDINHPSSSDASGQVTELAFLQEVISSSDADVGEGDISAILRQLETADNVAQGVESKLDKLLENLEGLLEGLEAS